LYVDASGAKRRFEGLLNADTDIILITNEAGKIVFTNAAAAKLFANRNGNVLGVSLEDMLNKPELFEMVISGKGDGTTEAMIAGRTYEANYSVIQDDGKVIGRALILRDITQGKQSEAARTESLSMLSHDLQDPLELSKGYLNMLSMVGDLNEQQAGYIAKIEQNIESISQLSMDMLNLERLASTRGLHIEKVELTSLVSEAVAELEARAKQKKVTVLLTGTKNDSVLIESDAALLKRAFYNLLDNAIKVSPRGAKVDVVIDGAKDPLVVSITDRGPGIAPVDHPKIFASGTSGQIAGLAIVKSVIERHRGRVWVESELGTGSTFHCELPLRQP
jgi:signal transduction histidine kinase